MLQPRIVVQYAVVTGDHPTLLAVFPESPFLRGADLDELRTEVETVARTLYGDNQFVIEYEQVEPERLPLAPVSYNQPKNMLVTGGPKDGERYWHAIPHRLCLVLDGKLHLWHYTPETETISGGELAVYDYAGAVTYTGLPR